MTVFTCEDTFEAMMTCIYEAWDSRLGHQNIRLSCDPLEDPQLFCTYRHIQAQPEKARKVISAIQKKISVKAYMTIYQAAMSGHPQKLDAIYRFLLLGFSYPGKVMHMLQEPVVHTIFQLSRSVTGEVHHFREFLRFSKAENGNIYMAFMEPKNHILTLLAPHFEDRMPSESWMITDRSRSIAAIHPADTSFYLTSLSPEMMHTLEESFLSSDSYTQLWKTFFHSVAIEQRKNPHCQNHMLPKRFRKHMTEFQS